MPAQNYRYKDRDFLGTTIISLFFLHDFPFAGSDLSITPYSIA